MKIAVSTLLLSLLCAATPTFAADEGTAALEAIGQINGTALACKQPALVSRARNSVATTAPKTRANGETFENATNAAFLAQGKAKCPDAATLANQLGAAEQRLQAAFKSTQ
ncbi:hypothetical protein GBK02_02405 [Dechloromonas sp. TW-R-39-2]|uniref:hypothetical protein n=1 Tax=Dechloromonas sp. TW-R-39-2 TaxID=2654218 RepID=UPI00193DF2C6|nr:hypothetical protein [Dechloromonas sp. TW-R-39-2]QRM18330.1 hypothetical protein GBK02_02405 [Dechloromonas sp. TW-R-39-2]